MPLFPQTPLYLLRGPLTIIKPVAQASQAMHGSLVDRGANGDLAGSDVRILSRSSNRNMSKSKGWTLQSSLLMLWMDENLSQQSNKNC